MSFHLRPIHKRTCRQCGARASVELFNDRNSSLGDYCARHGKTAVAELERLVAQPLPAHDVT